MRPSERWALLLAAAGWTACTDQPFVLDVPLRVVATSPSGGATGVARRLPDGGPATAEVSFSEALDPATVTAASVRLEALAVDGGASPVVAVVGYSDAGGRAVATLTPQAPLAWSARYRLSIDTTVRRLRDGSRLPTPVVAEFTTENPPPLAVVFARPSDQGTGVDGATERSPSLVVRFSEPVDCASVARPGNLAVHETWDERVAQGRTDEGREVPGTWRCNGAPAEDPDRLEGGDCASDLAADDPASWCVVSFQPHDAPPVLSWSSLLRVTLRGGAWSESPLQSARATPAGGQLPVTVTGSFRVVDPPPLALVAASPGDGAPRTARVALDFSEPVDCARLLASVRVEEIGDAHPHFEQPPGTLERVRVLWGNADPARNEGAWSCPDLSGVSPLDHSCGADGSRCRVRFAPAGHGRNPREPDPQALDFSSRVRVTLPGGAGGVASARATSRGGFLPATVVREVSIEDPPPFVLEAAAPADGAAGVARDAAIELRFSAPVDCESLRASAVVVEERDAHAHVPVPAQLAPAGGKVRLLWPPAGTAGAGGAWACPADAATPHVARFVPAPDPAGSGAPDGPLRPLAYSSRVVVTLPGAVYAPGQPPTPRVAESLSATTRGGALARTQTVAWRTEDPPPLLLLHVRPGGGASGIGRDETVLDFVFDQPIDCARPLAPETAATMVAVRELYDPVVAQALGAPEADVPGAVRVCTSQAFTWMPGTGSFRWRYSSEVRATLAAAGGAAPPVESRLATTRGGQLRASSAASRFFTVDPAPLRLVGVLPTDGAVGVPLDAPVELAFSREVLPSSLVPATHLAVSRRAVSLLSGAVVPAQGLVAADASGFLPGNRIYRFVPWSPAGGPALVRSAVVDVVVASPANWTGVRAADATTRGGWLQVDAADPEAPPPATSRAFFFRAVDPAPLGIAFTQPSAGGQAAGDADLLVAFTRPVLCGATDVAEPGVAADDGVAAAVVPAPAPPATAPRWVPACAAPDRVALALAARLNPPRPLQTVQVTVAAGIAAADATVLEDGTAFGVLPAGQQFTWQVQFVPLGVVSTAPAEGATAWPVANDLHVVFTAPVRPEALVPCATAPAGGGAGSPSGCNFQLLDMAAAGTPLAVAVSSAGGGAAQELVFHPAVPLLAGDNYRLTLFGGLYTPAGGSQIAVRLPSAAATSFLPGDFALSFQAGLPRVVAATSPVDGQTGVPPGAPICVTFSYPVDPATLTPANATVTFTSAQGSLVLPWSGTTHPAGTTWCLGLQPQAALALPGGTRTLLYGATYTVTVGAGVTLAGGNPQPNELPYSFSFTTQAQPPALAPVRYSNAFVSSRPLHGAAEVPTDARLAVSLSDEALSFVLGSVVAGSTVRLVAGTPPFAAAPAPVPASVVALSGGSLALAPDARLEPGAAYTLLLRAGQGGLQARAPGAEPAWIDTGDGYDLEVPFRTAPRTTAAILPYDPKISSELFIPVVFSRPVSLATATSAAIRGRQNGVDVAGFVSQYAPVPWAVNYVAQPTWPNNSSAAQEVSVLDGLILDELGNPVAGATRVWTAGTINLSAITAQTPAAPALDDTPTCAYLGPAGRTTSPCNLLASSGQVNRVLGDQALVVAFGATAIKDRMQPDTFSSSTVTLVPQGCPGRTEPVPLDLAFVPGCSLASGCPASPSPWAATGPADQLVIVPRGGASDLGARIGAGCTYLLTLRQSEFTNLYGLVPSGGANPAFALRGTEAAPRLTNARTADLVPGAAARDALALPTTNTGLSGRFALRVDLASSLNGQTDVADTVAPESVAANVVGSVVEGPGAFPAVTATAAGATVTLTPQPGQYFAAGTTYRVLLRGAGAPAGGLRDLAGNALDRDYAFQFAPETTAPVAQSAAYLPASAAFPAGAFKVVFSEPMRLESFANPVRGADGVVAPGTIDLRMGTGPRLLGLASVDRAAPHVVYFQPTAPAGQTPAPGSWTVVVGTAAADYAGNALAAAATFTVLVPAP